MQQVQATAAHGNVVPRATVGLHVPPQHVPASLGIPGNTIAQANGVQMAGNHISQVVPPWGIAHGLQVHLQQQQQQHMPPWLANDVQAGADASFHHQQGAHAAPIADRMVHHGFKQQLDAPAVAHQQQQQQPMHGLPANREMQQGAARAAHAAYQQQQKPVPCVLVAAQMQQQPVVDTVASN